MFIQIKFICYSTTILYYNITRKHTGCPTYIFLMSIPWIDLPAEVCSKTKTVIDSADN